VLLPTNGVTLLVTPPARRATNTLEKEQLSPLVRLLPRNWPEVGPRIKLDRQKLLKKSIFCYS
jgi:hypothetical protein